MRAALAFGLALTACFARPRDVAGELPVDAGVDAIEVDAPEAAVDAAPTPDGPPAPLCTTGETRCVAGALERCALEAWNPDPSCQTFCSAGSCVAPPSCSGIASCAGGNCCEASYEPGGAFKRSFDAVTATDDRYAATISPFLLDHFEVTVARYRRFVQAFSNTIVMPGSGANPHVAGDLGWQASWNTLLPADRPALEAALASCPGATYTTATTTGDDLPVNCVSWYLAYAFCAWDGGRLPTEAEWNSAAAAGSQQRVYPWSMTATSTDIASGLAVYATSALAPVGSRSPQGDSPSGVSDLAGNVAEWVVDAWSDPYPTTSCADCATLTTTTTRVLRGGSYVSSAGGVTAAFRTNGNPMNGIGTTGLRCARNP